MKRVLTLLLAALLALSATTVSLAEAPAEDVVNRLADTQVPDGYAVETGHDAKQADADSALFTEEDFRQAVALIDAECAGWGDVKIVTCSYAGDENCNEGELKALNDVSQGKHYTACMLFLTDIIGPSELEEVSAWEKPNEELKDYGWWLAREDGGAWELVTHGYC